MTEPQLLWSEHIVYETLGDDIQSLLEETLNLSFHSMRALGPATVAHHFVSDDEAGSVILRVVRTPDLQYAIELVSIGEATISNGRTTRIRAEVQAALQTAAHGHEPDAVTRVSVEIAGSEMSFETGRMAKQASGAVVVRQGDTMVLATAVAGNVRDVDFLPLTVDVEERMYAAGKIPGSFFKREGRSGEKGTLTARMIDRPIRPLFPKDWRYDTQLVAIPLSIDHVHPYDILAMNGASAALMISDIPLPTPVGAVRIGKVDGNFVVNPPEPGLQPDAEDGGSALDLIVAGTEEAILMVEAGANEIPEAEILDALDIAHAEIKKLCALQRDLAAKVGKEKKVFVPIAVDGQLLEEIRSSHGAQLDAATQVEDKLERQEATKAVEAAVLEHYAPASPESATEAQLVEAKARRSAVQLAFDKLEKQIIRERIAVHKKRPDGRSENEIRDITIEIGVLPRTHGSALFTRGQTQALSVVAMGTLKEEMRIDTLGLETKKYYWHHYNFPPFSVGEAGRMGGVKRRDIGHGALAERALAPMVPTIEEFPYSIRVVSDILESNGSSSMASVCGSSLALMDAGVPIKRPVAGIAMGLIKEGDDYVVLTDIAGVEDHLGDMDFKVAGTERGITALQMDIKITGVTFDILRDALAQAKEARTFILGKMADTIGTPREQLSQYAPRIQTVQIDPSQIGLLIGKGGETIRGLADEFESQIDVNDDGQVLIYSANGELGDALVERIRMMIKEVEVGDEYVGKVVKTTTFGAFIELAKGTDGLLHISNVSPGERVESVEDVLNKGDEVNVRVVEVDRERGRIGLRLAHDPDIAGKSVEELAGVGTGGGGSSREGRTSRNGPGQRSQRPARGRE
jgi:polyribonucleotide nucleotidyltransferase